MASASGRFSAASAVILAFGALSACRDYGVKVPDDVSILGLDDQEFAPYLVPSLTTVETPVRAVGEALGRAIIGKLEHGLPIQSIQMPSRIVVRHSVADA